MIQPDEIRRKALNLYPEFLASFLAGDGDFFPRDIRASKAPPGDDLSAAIQEVRRLREQSKEFTGTGYSVEWREVNSRKLGRNFFPARIFFANQEDFLACIGKQREFARFRQVAMEIRTAFPQLENWIRSHVALIIDRTTDATGLLEVVRYFQAHPRPDRFARELPLSVDSKFIERHQTILRDWFDLVLPASTIRADEEHFCRRYGIRYVEPNVAVRFLDPSLQMELGFPCSELYLPLHTLGNLSVADASAFIVENKVNLFTMPPLPRTIALGALGDNVTLFRHISWLSNVPITYWGDMDVEGFQILSSLRGLFPEARSFLMDRESLVRYRDSSGKGKGQKPGVPLFLRASEAAAFAICRDDNLRIEQERIPQADVIRELL